jgi:hypothetical protein
MHQWEYCYTSQVVLPENGLEVRLCTLEGEQVIQTFPFEDFGPGLTLAACKSLAWLGLEGWEACGSPGVMDPSYFKRPKRS